MKIVITCSCAMRSAPVRVDRVEAGDQRARTPSRSTVSTVSTVIATVKSAEVACVVAVLEVLHEERHERGRQDAAEDQLVDDVRRRVREVVGVGEAGAPDRVREHRDAEQAGEPREQRAGRDGGARADEPLAIGDSPSAAHEAGARRRARRVRKKWLPHQPARNRAARRA